MSGRLAVTMAWLALLASGACQPSRRVPSGPRAAVAANPSLTLTLRPVRAEGAEVTAVAVREEIGGPLEQDDGPFSLRVGIVYVSRAGIADRVDSLVVRDASGAVSLGVEDDSVNTGGYTYYRHWRARRRVRPPVVVTYRMRPVPKPTGGPQFEFHAHGGGISSHGSQLFVLPERLGTAEIRLRWDLQDLPRGSIAVSSYGEGDLRLRARPDTLVDPFFLVGPLGRYEPPGNTGFRAYWLGRPEYESRREMAWLYQAYENMRRFYRDSSTAPYRVFIRAVGYGGGTASGRSFMTAVNAGHEDSTRRAPRNNVAHEIGHYFVGSLGGDETAGLPWYDEGVNTHYTRLLLLRAGLMPASDFLAEVNNHARGYYTNPYRNVSADSIRLIGFSTGFGGASAQNLAYTRGSLFWADVDKRIREASLGRRTLDDVIVPLLVAQRTGAPLSQHTLFAALTNELGPAFLGLFDSVIMRGETLVPASGAFGPCFRRIEVTYTVQGSGAEIGGHGWERVPSVPDERCREW